MYTSLMVMALASSFAPAAVEAESPRWLRDYPSAWQKGAEDRKPLAVVFGSGEAGWEKLSRDGKLGKEVTSVLAAQYVCLYVDADGAEGKRLAQTFDVPEGIGLVISDRSGDKQAFHHQGDLKGEDLEYYLKKFADPNLVVRTTETNPPERGSVNQSRSYYQPVGGSAGRNC